MTIEKGINESVLDHKYRLLLEKSKGDAEYGWDDIEQELKIGLAKDTIRKGSIFLPEFEQYMFEKLSPNKGVDIPAYKEVVEHKADGSTSSDKLIRLTEEDMKTPEALIKAHGLDPNEWEMISSRNSMWNQTVDKTLYYSRVNVKPKVNGLNIDKLVEATKEAIESSKLQYCKTEGSGLLTLPFVDLHFGINTFEMYQEKLNDTLEVIQSKKWDTIYIPFGHDLLHNNDMKGKTANGTPIEKVDMTKAWKDAIKFYKTVFDASITNANTVVSDYVCGNHDADISWAFAQTLEEIYPQVKFNTSIENKKYFKWEKVLLISLHGDKGMKRVAKTMITKYRELALGAKCVEIYSGHLHAEKVVDDYGIITRTLPTSATEDDWHVENSFEGSVKSSQIFEYRTDKLKVVHYV